MATSTSTSTSTFTSTSTSTSTFTFTLVLLAVTAISAHAQTPEPLRVAVDWNQVSDADIQRCGLSRLRAGTIERLVDKGYAVVDVAAADGIRVVVASVDYGLRIHAESAGIARDEVLRTGASCDATFVLDVISRIAELVEEIAAERPAPPPAVPAATVAPAARAEPTPAAQRSAWQVSLDAVLRVNDSPALQFGGGLELRRRFSGAWEAGVRADLTGNTHLGVTVLEPFLALTAAWQPALPGAGVYVEAGPLLHFGTSDTRSVVEVDAMLGAGLQLSLGHVLVQLGPNVRLRRFQHVVGDESAFDTGRFGLSLRIGAQLSGS